MAATKRSMRSVLKTQKIQKTITLRVIRRFQEPCESPPGSTRYVSEVERVEVEGELEVFIDMDKLLNHYASEAFHNKQKRFVRGPLEVRVVNMKETSERRVEFLGRPGAK